MIDLIARMGGILAILGMIHFVIDWVFQSHATAMSKHKDAYVRALHCLLYVTPFVALFGLLHVPPFATANLTGWLWLTHFFEDSYWPVVWWAKHIRRPLELEGLANLRQWFDTPLGKILLIAIDQIIHIVCLLPVAYVLATQVP